MINIKLGDVVLNAIMKILDIICDENYIKYKEVFSGDVILFLLRQFYFCTTKAKNKLFQIKYIAVNSIQCICLYT